MEVLGRESEVAGAEFLDHPCNLVHARPPARCPPAPPVHNPLCPVRLIGIAQPAKVPLAHPQQLRCLHAAQLLRLMQPNRIDDPGHSDLRQHAIPPVKTGQIVCRTGPPPGGMIGPRRWRPEHESEGRRTALWAYRPVSFASRCPESDRPRFAYPGRL